MHQLLTLVIDPLLALYKSHAMEHFIGIDIGTSGVKSILIDAKFQIIDQQTVPLSISRPKDLWSEQNPVDWWQAVCETLDTISARNKDLMATVKSIGLAGQMHGAVLLDNQGNVLRPAILWNDGRCEEECKELETKCPVLRGITGNIAMPGFTAPKLLWVYNHERDIFNKINKVLLPKDYIRWHFTGTFFSDCSDAAGTLWLDVEKRQWSETVLRACNLSEDNMPQICEGTDNTGTIKPDLAARWGLHDSVILAGGAGDNAAGAVGIGALCNNRGFVSLGTSGVYFISTPSYKACPEKTVHSFCHAVPNTWHQMGVVLSAASCLKTLSIWLGFNNEKDMFARFSVSDYDPESQVVFKPYLSGERTPHNNPHLTGSFLGLTHSTSQANLIQAVMEGVAFAIKDCEDALGEAGSIAHQVALIGGGARSEVWRKIIATVLDKKIIYFKDADHGPAFGAAKLAAIAYNKDKTQDVMIEPAIDTVDLPVDEWQKNLKIRLENYRK